MENTNLNLNETECLVKAYNMTEIVVTNICNGAVSTVPYGTLDFFGIVFVVLLMAVSLVSVTKIIFRRLSPPHKYSSTLYENRAMNSGWKRNRKLVQGLALRLWGWQ